MTRLITALWLTLATLATSIPAHAQVIPLSVLVTERARFDQQQVTVVGTVSVGGSPGGPAQRFTLMADGMTVEVVATAGIPMNPGMRVEVEGVYRYSTNSIEAFRVSPR
jgi:hypothetical protein